MKMKIIIIIALMLIGIYFFLVRSDSSPPATVQKIENSVTPADADTTIEGNDQVIKGKAPPLFPGELTSQSSFSQLATPPGQDLLTLLEKDNEITVLTETAAKIIRVAGECLNSLPCEIERFEQNTLNNAILFSIHALKKLNDEPNNWYQQGELSILFTSEDETTQSLALELFLLNKLDREQLLEDLLNDAPKFSGMGKVAFFLTLSHLTTIQTTLQHNFFSALHESFAGDDFDTVLKLLKKFIPSSGLALPQIVPLIASLCSRSDLQENIAAKRMLNHQIKLLDMEQLLPCAQ